MSTLNLKIGYKFDQSVLIYTFLCMEHTAWFIRQLRLLQEGFDISLTDQI